MLTLSHARVVPETVFETQVVVYNFGICQIVQIGKNLGFSGSKTIIILAMFAKNRKIPALNLALRN